MLSLVKLKRRSHFKAGTLLGEQNDELPQLANFAFQCRNPVYVKYICSLRCFKSPRCRALFCDKFAKLYIDDMRSLVALILHLAKVVWCFTELPTLFSGHSA